MIIVPFIDTHLEGFEVQKDQMLINKYLMDPGYISTISNYGEAYTGLVSGKPVIIAGMIQPHEHIGMLWAVLEKDCKDHLFSATRHVQGQLSKWKVPRMETAIRTGFKAGRRWAEILGFSYEGTMKKYDMDGGSCDLYARYQ